MGRITFRTLLAHKRRLLATSAAVILGVAFLSSTLVLGATLTNGFSAIVAEANAGTDALVRSSVLLGGDDVTERGLLDRSLTHTIAAVDGVAEVATRIEGAGRIVGADGDPIGPGPWITGNWIENEQLNPYDLVEGRAPAGAGEVVINQAAAEEGDLTIGDMTEVRVPDPVAVTIVGVATYGPADSAGPATYAGFTTEFAHQVLMPERGKLSSIAVEAEPGVSQTSLIDRLEGVLPQAVEALTGAELTRETQVAIQGDDQESLQTLLMIFAGVALVVAAFSVHNTLSILVAQRCRQSALLRALGASRGQVLRWVTGEALAVGLTASVVGIAVGMGMAVGLLHLMEGIGLSTPASSPVFDVSTVVAPLAVGVVVTLLASLGPALRASRAAPLAALREAATDDSTTSRLRTVTGAVVISSGIAFAMIGAVGEALAVTGLGMLATMVGVAVVGPSIARAAAGVLGTPLAARGVAGALARGNAMRNPRRTASTAAPLMIGVAVVSLLAVVGTSLKQSVAEAIDAQFAGDLMIVGEGRGGLSTELAPAVNALPEVDAASPTGGARVQIDGESMLATTIDPATIESVMDLGVTHGSLRDIRPDEVVVSTEYAKDHGLSLGDSVTVGYPDGVTEHLSVGAIHTDDELSESAGIRLHRDAYLPHTARPADVNILIALAPGVTDSEGEAAVQRVADRFGAPDVQTNEEFSDAVADEIDVILTIVYVLLVIAVVIAVMGIANTLSLSIHERAREVGLLRALGQTRRQTRAMVRGEALIVALYGTLGGLVLGAFFGWALVSALAGEGFSAFAVPTGTLAIVLALGALVAVAAAARPAHRTASMDLLSAIATE